MDANRNLLFGLLGLQNGMIDAGMLVSAFQAWTQNRSRNLANFLIASKSIDEEQQRVLEMLVDLHLRKHGGNSLQSLAAISIDATVRDRISQVGDLKLDESLVHVGQRAGGSRENETMTFVGTASDSVRFQLLRPHAQGGLGAVSVAMDRELHREVALKEILEQFASDVGSRQRFLLEAEITGGLEHPGIVPVYGLGAYADGRPFYAMRFIRGDSLKHAIDDFHSGENSKSPSALSSIEFRKLLGRFLDVCHAIEYAHSRGVLHRDLKPGNIMLGKYGETLVVDWGLAKALGKSDQFSPNEELVLVPSSGSSIDMTQFGTAIGTPAYMSPEQAIGRLDQLGPHSDVYSLGATLYHMLVGSPPFGKAPVHETLEKVRAGRLPLPSTVQPNVPRVLEAICMKAMAFEPENRYASAGQLAEEVEKWLADEPVSCIKESRTDYIRRWMKRHRTLVVSTSVAATVLFAASLAIAVMVVQNNRSLDTKNRELDESNSKLATANDALTLAVNAERDAKLLAEQKRIEAVHAREETDQVLEYIVAAFRKPDPAADGEKLTVAELFAQSEKQIDEQFAKLPRVQIQLLSAIGQTYLGLGLHPKAAAVFQRTVKLKENEFGVDHPNTLESKSKLGFALLYAEQLNVAVEVNEETWKQMKRVLGEDDLRTIRVANDLGQAYGMLGRLDESLALLKHVLKVRSEKLGPEHGQTMETMCTLASCFHAIGKPEEALPLLKEVFATRLEKLGPEHPQTLQMMNDLAGNYHMSGNIKQAISIYEMMVEMMESKLGADHPETLIGKSNLAFAYNSTGRFEDELRVLESAVEAMKEKLGPKNGITLATMNSLAVIYMDSQRLADAVKMLEWVVEAEAEALGKDNRQTLASEGNLAAAYSNLGRSAEALEISKQVAERLVSTLGAEHRLTLNELGNQAMYHMECNQPNEAVAILEEIIPVSEKSLGIEDSQTLIAISNLALAYKATDRSDDALRNFEIVLDRWPRKTGNKMPSLTKTLKHFIELLMLTGDVEKSKLYQEKLNELEKSNASNM